MNPSMFSQFEALISVAMIASGLLPFESAIFIVIGANLGTSFIAIIASLADRLC